MRSLSVMQVEMLSFLTKRGATQATYILPNFKPNVTGMQVKMEWSPDSFFPFLLKRTSTFVADFSERSEGQYFNCHVSLLSKEKGCMAVGRVIRS
ncbi:hypothetical protein CEXT_796771 [Caerostris extrusa]|uniref:Uncharacterized protein n=1 Tax=Caerostris extrusa TaxID=172846 RepID=A0AAV4XAT1_CAEEX|nr:hypothetical protein CEXT_796771 [Caerostris extrusa]